MLKKTLLLSSTVVLATAIAVPAYAQFDDEIIVTATKREQTLQEVPIACLLYTSPSPRDATLSRMPSSA